METEAILQVFRKDGGRSRVGVSDTLIVGRSDGTGLHFPDDRSVSPKHARFIREGKSLFVEDLGSVNGVFVRVRDTVMLENKDRIKIGCHIFSFELIPHLDSVKRNITKVFNDPTTEVIGTPGVPALARLVIQLDSGERGKEYDIGDHAIVLGRGRGTHNFMRDPSISRRHAIIEPNGEGGFQITDLSSRFGTWRQTRGRVPLVAGQEILIGRERVEVVSV